MAEFILEVKSVKPETSFPTLAEVEHALIRKALERTLWNRRDAAKLLDISYNTLRRRIDIYNIKRESQLDVPQTLELRPA